VGQFEFPDPAYNRLGNQIDPCGIVPRSATLTIPLATNFRIARRDRVSGFLAIQP
jgi:hypothetical protein